MILIFNQHTNGIWAFQTYTGLYNYTEAQEKQRHLEKPQRHAPRRKWIFARHPYNRMAALVSHISKTPLATPEFEGDGRGFDVLEIVQGNPKKPTFIPVAPDADVELWRKKWCKAYARAHGYLLAEISDILNFQKLVKNLDNDGI